MIRVVAGIIEKKGLILIARRGPGKHLEGYWEFPGGKIEDFETPENGLMRELLEELNITIELKKRLSTITHHYPEKSIMLFSFTAKIISGEILLKDHDKYEWIKIEEIHNFKLAEADISLIKEYEKLKPKR
jgi:8-oxo-dGTP diphosphatase